MFIWKGNLFSSEKIPVSWISDILQSELQFEFGPY